MKSLSGKIFILVPILVILTVAFFFLNSLKYSISNITADNYSTILTKDSKQSLTEIAPVVSVVFSDRYIFYTAKHFSTFPGYQRVISVGDDKYSISLKNLTNNNLFTLTYPDKKSNVLLSVAVSNAGNNGVIANGKQTIDELASKYGFMYMQSEQKRHSDIIILEYEDVFVIGQVITNVNSTFSSITFELFKRKIFFQSF